MRSCRRVLLLAWVGFAACGGDDDPKSDLIRVWTSSNQYERGRYAQVTVDNISDRQLGLYFEGCAYVERRNGGKWQTESGDPAPEEPCARGVPVIVHGHRSHSSVLPVGGQGGTKRFVMSVEIRDSAIAGGYSPFIPREQARSNEFRVY